MYPIWPLAGAAPRRPRAIHFARQGALGLLLNLGTADRMMCGHEMTAHPQLGHCRRTFEKRVLDARACSLNARACSFEKGVLDRRRKGAASTCSLSPFVQGAPWTPRRCGSERKLELCCAGCVHTTHTTASRAPALDFCLVLALAIALARLRGRGAVRRGALLLRSKGGMSGAAGTVEDDVVAWEQFLGSAGINRRRLAGQSIAAQENILV